MGRRCLRTQNLIVTIPKWETISANYYKKEKKNNEILQKSKWTDYSKLAGYGVLCILKYKICTYINEVIIFFVGIL